MFRDKKFFPIHTETSCQLKWNWSTIKIQAGVTGSCHRTAFSKLTKDNFQNFHNTNLKIQDRERMLAGQWPESSCAYCKNIEESGGTSDRQLHLTIPNLVPTELATDTTATRVTPTILEVYFNNTCNLACLYCKDFFSSTIKQENLKFGPFSKNGVELINSDKVSPEDLLPEFWKWLNENYSSLKRIHILGGESFYQKELSTLLDFLSQNSNPECEINIVSNLAVPNTTIKNYILRFRDLVKEKKIKRLDITASLDCFGPEQEYVRYGLDLNQWIENFKYLMGHKWLRLNVNQTISVLTIKTMPDLIRFINDCKQQRPIGHYFSGVTPSPSYLFPNILGSEEFDSTFLEILDLMPKTSDEEKTAHQYMLGIISSIRNSRLNLEEVVKLITFLDEKDRRRDTNWRTTFPWLVKYGELCGITK